MPFDNLEQQGGGGAVGAALLSAANVFTNTNEFDQNLTFGPNVSQLLFQRNSAVMDFNFAAGTSPKATLSNGASFIFQDGSSNYALQVGAAASLGKVIISNGGTYMVQLGSTDAMTAFATGGQASATACNSQVCRFTTVATAGDSGKIRALVLGDIQYIHNDGAASMNVFGQSGVAINGGAANAAFAIPAGQSAEFHGKTATTIRALLI